MGGGNGVGRALSLALTAWLLLILVATVQAVVPVRWSCHIAGPDVILLVILFVGLQARENLAMACLFAALLGYLGDLFAGSPKGLHLLAYVLAMLVARAGSVRLMVRGRIVTAFVSLVFALGFGTLLHVLRLSLDPELGWGPMRQVPFCAAGTALVSPFVFRLLTRIDRRFTRDPHLLGATR